MNAALPRRTDRLAPAPGVRRLTLGRRSLLFCERRQQLFELDAEAAATWDSLTAGRDLCSERALSWMEGGWLVPLALTGRLAGPASEVMRLRLGEAEVRLELRLKDDDAIRRHLHDAFAQFAGEVRPDALRLDVVGWAGRYWVLQGDVPLGLLAPERVVPEIKARLTEEICRQDADGGFLLHAALLASGGRGLLLSGPPGAGKTTLALALATRGLGYGSDDLVSVSRDAVFRGIRFSPAVKEGAWGLLADHVPGLEGLPTHQRADGQAVRYLPAARLPAGPIDAPRWALRLQRQDAGAAALHPLDPVDAMTELLGGAFAADHRLAGDTLIALADCVARMECYRLVYSDLGSAIACVEALVNA